MKDLIKKIVIDEETSSAYAVSTMSLKDFTTAAFEKYGPRENKRQNPKRTVFFLLAHHVRDVKDLGRKHMSFHFVAPSGLTYLLTADGEQKQTKSFVDPNASKASKPSALKSPAKSATKKAASKSAPAAQVPA